MRKLLIAVLSLGFVSEAFANWETGGGDDGARITVAFRGGIAKPIAAKMENDLGFMPITYSTTDGNYYYIDDRTCGGNNCIAAGGIDIGALAAADKYDSMSWAGGASVGMRMGGRPNLRAELDWLRISETRYNANPLFTGTMDMYEVSGGQITDPAVLYNTYPVYVASARTSASTDIISAMVYYDFFEGNKQPLGTMVPYVGVGIGYAISTTILELTDFGGDLSGDLSMQDFGVCQSISGVTICDFYTSQTETNNFALSGALGFSYGLDRGIFFDMGARATYIPKIIWALNNGANDNATTPRERDIFSANNVVYMNIYAGVRFEF